MFGSTVLEVGIGMVFVYLLLSLMASVIKEIIGSMGKWRATHLREGIRRMLGDQQFTPAGAAARPLVDVFYDSPFIRGLRGNGGDAPTYIPSRAFALALLDTLAPPPGDAPHTPATVRQAVANLPNDLKIRSVLLNILDSSVTDMTKAREGIERWFDESMDQVTGWYRKQAHRCMYVVAAAVCLVTNADSLEIGRALWTEPKLRAGVVKAAEKYAEKYAESAPASAASAAPKPATGSPPVGGPMVPGPGGPAGHQTAPGQPPAGPPGHPDPGGRPGPGGPQAAPGQPPAGPPGQPAPPPPGRVPNPNPTPAAPPIPAPPQPTAEDLTKELKEQVKNLKEINQELASLDIPMGWTRDKFVAVSTPPPPPKGTQWDSGEKVSYFLTHWIEKLFGIAITALAVSLGAPFWFDVLNQLVNLRSGKKPEKTREKT